MRDSFVLYRSQLEAVEELESEHSQLKILKTLCYFALDDKTPELSDFERDERIILKMAIPNILAASRNYERGKNGGRPSIRNPELEALVISDCENGKTNKEIAEAHNISERTVCTILRDEKQRKNSRKNAKSNDNVNVNVNDNVNANANDNANVNDNVNVNLKNNNNSIPTQKQIADFCAENNLIVKPEEFFSYYNERGWELVYDWKNLLKKWNKNQLERIAEKSNNPYAAIMEA